MFISRKKYSGSSPSPAENRPSIVPGADVVHRPRRVHADLPDALASLRVDDPFGRRGLLDHLLVAALDRAVALAEVDHVAVAVGEHLHLDVARVVQIALEVDRGVGEELLAFATGALEGALELLRGERHAEALAAAAAGRLDGDGEADLRLAIRSASARVATGSVVPGTIGTPAACISSRALVLEPIASIALAGGPMNTIPASSQACANGGVLGQEAVAGVDRLGAGALGRVDDLLDVQVVLRRRPVAEVVGLAGARDVGRVAVELGVDGHARDRRARPARARCERRSRRGWRSGPC